MIHNNICKVMCFMINMCAAVQGRSVSLKTGTPAMGAAWAFPRPIEP